MSEATHVPSPALENPTAAEARPDPDDTKVETPPGGDGAASEIPDAEAEKSAPTGESTEAPDAEKGGDDAETSEKPADAPAADVSKVDEDEKTEEPKDAPADEGSGVGQTAEQAASNGTPASTSKKPKRKSSTGVPEHKTKKLGKKKSQVFTTHLDAAPGEYYLARMKGHAPWPSIICDEEMLPFSLISSRPTTAMRKDGTYRPDFADGGKRINDRTFPVMFLETNEFGWIPNTELYELNPDAGEKAKGKALKAAYAVAAEGHDLEYFKTMLHEHQSAVQADEQARADRAAKKGAKGRRKSEVVSEPEDEDVEMEDVSGEPASDEGETAKPKSKKRKKDAADSDGEGSKPVKTPKRSNSTKKTTKLKLTTPKTPNGTSEAKATPKSGSAAKSAKPKAASAKKATGKAAKKEKEEVPAAEDEWTDADSDKPEKPLTIAESREQKEKAILFLRHKLQRGFLTRDQTPREEEMKTMSDYIAKLETYKDLEISIIRATKINKVLKNVMKLSTIPRDEEFSFKQRSFALLQNWNHLLAQGSTGQGESSKEGGAAAATTNGENKGEGEGDEEHTESSEKEKPAKSPSAAAEPKAESAEPAKEPTPAPAAAATTTTEESAADEKKEESETVAAEPAAPIEAKTEAPAPAAEVTSTTEGEEGATAEAAETGAETEV